VAIVPEEDQLKQLSLNPIKLFRYRSIFATVIISMVSLCIILSLIFSYFFTNTIIDKVTEQKVHTDQAYVNTIAEDTDYILMSLHQSLTQLSFSFNVFTLAFSNQIDENRANLAMTDIALAVSNNFMIESAALYLPKENLILSSTYTKYSIDNYFNRAIIDHHELQTDQSITLADTSARTSSLFYYEGKLVMARDFPLSGEKRLATIYYFINLHELYRTLTNQLPAESNLWVYDAFGNPVFSREASYPDTITAETLTELESSAEYPKKIEQTAYFLGTSKDLSWDFMYAINEATLRPSVASIITILIPIILAILVIAFIVALIIAYKLDRPFQRLLNAIESKNLAPDALKSSKNEFDYLNYAFTEIAGHQSELRSMMCNVSHDVMSRLFFDLLSGTQISFDHVREVLKSIQSPFHANAIYVANVLRFKSDLTLTDGKRLLILSDLSALLDIFDQKCQALSHVLVNDSHTFVIIISFNVDAPILKIKKELGELESSIMDLTRKHGYPAQFCSGHFYHSILDVGFSYKKALASLAHDRTSSNSDKDPSELSEGSDVDFHTRAHQVISLVLNNDPQGAQTLSDRIINHISETIFDNKTQIEAYEAYISALLDIIARQEHFDVSSIPNKSLFLLHKKEVISDAAMVANLAKESCLYIISETSRIIKRQQNHFLVAAQDYISQHYGDYNLSLNSIAEAINANPSYLSRLFKVNLGVNFTDYLNDYRVAQSVYLLENTNRSIKDIALASGYNSVQNYIRVFKKYINKTPGQHREDYGKCESNDLK
jgi:AraC-like DNA-binding protein/methyl-accepting chemotaxis protein